MAPFFSDQDLANVHSTNRALMRKQQSERKFRKICANLLLKGGMSRDVCRGLLLNGYLFSDEEQQACAILQQQITALYDDIDEVKAYQEPISPECIHFMFRLIDHPIPSGLDGILDMMIINRYHTEEGALSQLYETNEKRIAKRIKEREELQSTIQHHYPIALLTFLSVVSGVVTLFIGFDKWTYPEMVIGLLLISPVFLLRESNQRVIQFRRDVTIENKIIELNKQIAWLQKQIQEQKQKMSQLQNQLRSTPRITENTDR